MKAVWRWVASVIFLVGLIVPRLAIAQAFPAKPILLICPWPAGGGADTQMRALAQSAARHLGQNIVVENRPGAVGTIGPGVVARSKPDGYTLSQSHNAVLRQPFIAPTPYDPANDFTYIIGVSDFPFGLAVRADAPWMSFAEFIDHARRNPNAVSFAIPGRGAPGHIVMDRIAELARIQWTAVPYKGTAESMTALMGGHVAAAAESTGWAPFVDSGKARLLAVFGTQRLKKYPHVPTLKEIGYDVADASPWGIVGPSNMEPTVVKILHDAFKKALDDPEFIAVLANLAQEPVYMTGEQYRAFALAMIPYQRTIVEKYNLKAN